MSVHRLMTSTQRKRRFLPEGPPDALQTEPTRGLTRAKVLPVPTRRKRNMMLRHVSLALSVVALGVGCCGCVIPIFTVRVPIDTSSPVPASRVISGARRVGRDTPTAGALARWDMPACTAPDGRPLPPPSGIHYYFLKSVAGTQFFEQAADGSGVIVENQWRDSAGTHYYAWTEAESKGWEFIIPGPGQPGLRRSYATGTTDGRPNGSWVAECTMVPVDDDAKSAKTHDGAPSSPTSASPPAGAPPPGMYYPPPPADAPPPGTYYVPPPADAAPPAAYYPPPPAGYPSPGASYYLPSGGYYVPLAPPPPAMERRSSGLMVTGIVLMSAGALAAAVGAVGLTNTSTNTAGNDDCSNHGGCSTLSEGAGVGLVAGGLVGVAVGVPLTLIGAKKVPVDKTTALAGTGLPAWVGEPAARGWRWQF